MLMCLMQIYSDLGYAENKIVYQSTLNSFLASSDLCCMLIAFANTVKPALSGHSKIDKTKLLMTNGSLMKV